MPYTPVPNNLFDYHLKTLTPSELKVLLVVVRQTLGYYDPITGGRKKVAWIARSVFSSRTGLSNSYVSKAIDKLAHKGLIIITGHNGIALATSASRQLQQRLFFQCAISNHKKTSQPSEEMSRTSEVSLPFEGTKPHTIKEIKKEKKLSLCEVEKLRYHNACDDIKPYLTPPET